MNKSTQPPAPTTDRQLWIKQNPHGSFEGIYRWDNGEWVKQKIREDFVRVRAADAKNKLAEIRATGCSHDTADLAADKILCELLWNLDCKEVVEEYQKVKRWPR